MSTHAGWGALVGILPGLVVGALLAIRGAVANDAAGAPSHIDRRLLALPLAGAVLGAGAGALIGAAVGALLARL